MRKLVMLMLSSVLCLGCTHLGGENNGGQVESYPVPMIEASWIRNGEPIVFEGKQWFPIKDVEILRDSEVYQIGEYKEVQIFVDKVDIKPYDRIYTKFGRHKYRYFERPKND